MFGGSVEGSVVEGASQMLFGAQKGGRPLRRRLVLRTAFPELDDDGPHQVCAAHRLEGLVWPGYGMVTSCRRTGCLV
jgi:hypothetical protein